jgi:hypothetical protein
MTLSSFNLLDEKNKHLAICKYGVRVGNRATRVNTILHFQLFNFYVEIAFHPKSHVLKWVSSFDNTDFLTVYTKKTNIECLLKNKGKNDPI